MPKHSLEDIGTWIQNTTSMTDEQAQIIKGLAGFIPIVGTGIDIYDAINNPTGENIGWAIAGGLTDIIGGRIIAKAAKAAKVANKANKAVKSMSDIEKATKLRHAQQEAVRVAKERAISQEGRTATNIELYSEANKARHSLENAWQRATTRTIKTGNKYNRNTKVVDRDTSALDPYYIKGLGYVFGDMGLNSIQNAYNEYNK